VFSSSTNSKLSLTLENLQFTLSRFKMQKLFCLLLCFSLCIYSGFAAKFVIENFSESVNGLVIPALRELVRDYFSKRLESFDFVIYGRKPEHFLEIVNEVAKVSEVPVNVFKIKNLTKNFTFNQSAIILFDTYSSCRDFHHIVLFGIEFRKNLTFISYIEDADRDSNRFVQHIEFRLEILEILQFENFLVFNSSSKALVLYTFSFYHQPNCLAPHFTLINRFFKKIKKWENRDFDIVKYNNYHGCPVRLRSKFDQLQVFFRDKNNETSGYGLNIIKEISEKLNFTFHYLRMYDRDGSYIIQHADIDFLSDSLWKIKFRKEFPRHVSTAAFTTVDDVVLISRFPPHSKFEKIFMPFEIEVWHWLIATLVIALAVICGFKLAPTYVRKFVFGSKVQTPIMNLT
jgi:hypothetical protein